MTKAEYIEEIHNFFKTDDYKLNWNGYSTKKEAQKNGVEEPACTVKFLKDGAVVRTATCGTEIECLREVYKEVYDAWYQEWSKEYEKESAIAAEAARKEMEERFEAERISKMESDIQCSIRDRILAFVVLKTGKTRSCFVAGYGVLENGDKAIAVFQYSGTPEEDNNKWLIFNEKDIMSFRLMNEVFVGDGFIVNWDKVPDGMSTTEIWNEFKTFFFKVECPIVEDKMCGTKEPCNTEMKKEKKGFLSRIFGR